MNEKREKSVVCKLTSLQGPPTLPSCTGSVSCGTPSWRRGRRSYHHPPCSLTVWAPGQTWLVAEFYPWTFYSPAEYNGTNLNQAVGVFLHFLQCRTVRVFFFVVVVGINLRKGDCSLHGLWLCLYPWMHACALGIGLWLVRACPASLFDVQSV